MSYPEDNENYAFGSLVGLAAIVAVPFLVVAGYGVKFWMGW